MERGAGRKRVKRKEEKGEGWRKGRTTSTARISERRVSRIPLSPPFPRIPLVGGYRVTAIRLNLFHHKRLNKEVHSSARANPPLKKTDLPATLIGLRPPLTIIHLDLFLPWSRASTNVMVLFPSHCSAGFFRDTFNPLIATGIVTSVTNELDLVSVVRFDRRKYRICS